MLELLFIILSGTLLKSKMWNSFHEYCINWWTISLSRLRNSRGRSTSSAEERCISCQQLGSWNRRGEAGCPPPPPLLQLQSSCNNIWQRPAQCCSHSSPRAYLIFQDDKVAHKRKHNNIVNQRWSSCIHPLHRQPVSYSAYCSLFISWYCPEKWGQIW